MNNQKGNQPNTPVNNQDLLSKNKIPPIDSDKNIDLLKEFNSTPIDTPTSISLSDNLEPSKSLTTESSSIEESNPKLVSDSQVEPGLELKPVSEPSPKPEIDTTQDTEFLSLTETEPLSQLDLESAPESEIQPQLDPEVVLKPDPDIESDLDVEPLLTMPSEPQPSNPVSEDPETIKQKIEEVLSYNSTNSVINSQPDKPKTSSFLKTIFALSLIIFIIIVIGLAYFILNPTLKTNSEVKITPTSSPIQTKVTCELNGFIYSQDQSFPSADGCNTCTCVSTNNITCTEKDCTDVVVTLNPTKTATTSSTSLLSPEKTVQTFYQDYIKTSPLSYENSPYLTLSLIKSLDEIKNKTTNSDPVLYSSIIPDCGVTTNEAVIKNNLATVTVFLCHKNEGKQYLSINLVLENSQWKINKISLP